MANNSISGDSVLQKQFAGIKESIKIYQNIRQELLVLRNIFFVYSIVVLNFTFTGKDGRKNGNDETGIVLSTNGVDKLRFVPYL